jgi:hypothetical protein
MHAKDNGSRENAFASVQRLLRSPRSLGSNNQHERIERIVSLA